MFTLKYRKSKGKVFIKCFCVFGLVYGQKATIYIIAIGLFLIMVNSSSNYTEAKTVKCEDVKGVMKWKPTDHDDNNPSEKKFEKMIFKENATTCEVAKAYDHDIVKGTIEKEDWKEFKISFVYEGTSEDVQDCLDYRYKLPDDGKPALQAYEILDCAVGNY